MLETTLQSLFDYQRFEREPSLQDVIDSVLEKYAENRLVSLSDDDVALAAGGTGPIEPEIREDRNDGHGTV